MTAVERGVDALADAIAILVGGPRPARLDDEADGDGGQHDAGCSEEKGEPAAALLPDRQHARDRVQHRDLAKGRGEVAHGRDGLDAVRKCDAHHAGAVAEGGERLGRAEEIDERAPGLADRGFAGDDMAVLGADMDDAAMGSEMARGEGGEHHLRRQSSLRGVVEFTREQGRDEIHVAGRISERVLAHRGGLDRGAGGEQDDEERDQAGNDGSDGRLETLETLVKRMCQ